MPIRAWTFILVGLSFVLYIAIAILTRAKSTGEFYVAGKGVHPIANGMATAADWMSAASFLSMAGIISFAGYDGSVYLMGWTGGYVLLALLLAPYLRKYGKYTVPDFVGDRYYSQFARIVAVVCAIFISFTYVAGQMRGVGVVFARFLDVDVTYGVLIGMGLVFFYAVLGGMKGITYTQVAQYCVLIFAFMVPAIFVSIMLTSNPIPQIGFGGELAGELGSQIAGGEHVRLLDKLNGLHQELGFAAYTDGSKPLLDMVCITLALMVGTAGLPHVIVRFYTVPKVRDARISAGWALLFIAILYTTAPAVAAFARTNLIASVEGAGYSRQDAGAGAKVLPEWFANWEATGLLAWVDKNGDGRVQYRKGAAFVGKPEFVGQADLDRGDYATLIGRSGERLVKNTLDTSNDNELYIDNDIIVLANPEIARLPNWVVGLVAAGGLAAALSTAAGLLLVVSTAVSHDLLKRALKPDITEKQELNAARAAAALAVVGAGYLGINPPGFVAEVVAFAFGLAASSFFPAIMLGIFVKRASREGVVAGMIAGIAFTAGYILMFQFHFGPLDSLLATVSGWEPGAPKKGYYLFGISPAGIGSVGMLINFAVSIVVSAMTPAPPAAVQEMVEQIRVPAGAGEAHEMQVPPV
ncbi:MAG: cation acetate symporter [Phycisphaerales bacterium]|nr:cation acetate symporter [Phycisphaerales bacterium]